MPTFEQLQPASFRGVPFLVDTETKSGGKKTVTHEYVGSDKRFTEELGLLPPSFSLEAVVADSFFDEELVGPQRIFNSLQKRIRLEQALNQPGLGELVHPVYGSIQVKATTYSVNSNQTRTGEFRFSINFESSESVITLDIIQPTISTVSDNADITRTALDNALESGIVGTDVPGYTPDVLSATADKMIDETAPAEGEETSIYDTVFSFATKTVGAIQEKVSTFTRFVSDTRSSIFTIVQKPFEIKNNIKALYQSALDIVNTPGELSETWERLIDFGFLDIPLLINTVTRQNSENNKSVLNEHTRLTALTNLYEASADKDYSTEDEIKNQQSVLDESYKRLMEGFKDDIDTDSVSVLAMDADFKAAMTNLRTTTKAVLDQKAQNAFKVVTINPGTSSMALTAYRFYGDHNNLDELQELNPLKNHANFKGEIQAVSG